MTKYGAAFSDYIRLVLHHIILILITPIITVEDACLNNWTAAVHQVLYPSAITHI